MLLKKHKLLFFLLFSIAIPSFASTYYVSPSGNDENTGTNEVRPWRSLRKVNTFNFQPGDSILFEGGSEWLGNLRPKGNGAPGRPIVISSYGDGSMPIINIGRRPGIGISLVNQSWWEIEHIEITSDDQHRLGYRRGGIRVTAEGEGARIEHIVIRNCYIHDVWGDVGGSKSGIAIYVGQPILGNEEMRRVRTDDVLVENNVIKRVDKIGIAVNGNEGVVVRKNYLENIGGDGIIVIGANRALVEDNVADRTCLRTGDPDIDTGGKNWWPHTAAIWLWRNTESIMQYNEVYNTGRQPGNGDGFAYDLDLDCRRCIIQYNYSANNHGFLLLMNRTQNNIARYNISQNDQSHLIQIHGNTEDGNLVHNNVFYIDHSTVDIDYYCGEKQDRDKSRLGASFLNNVFFAGGQGRFRTVYSYGSALNRQFIDSLYFAPSEGGSLFESNCFYGPWKNGRPDDAMRISENPRFVEVGSGWIGRTSLKGYQLKRDSPLINAGKRIRNSRIRDFYGNLGQDSRPDIGVHEFVRR